jgi:hypothetical protein
MFGVLDAAGTLASLYGSGRLADRQMWMFDMVAAYNQGKFDHVAWRAKSCLKSHVIGCTAQH